MDRSHFVGHFHERPGSCDHRPRRCLLKGCERRFWPKRPERVIAVKSANKQLGAGDAGSRASVTGPPSRAKNSGGSRAGVIASVCASVKLRRLMRMDRARASASVGVCGFCDAAVRRPGCYEVFPSLLNLRTDVFAVWRAAWRYVACWIGKRSYRRISRRQRRARMTSRCQRRDAS